MGKKKRKVQNNSKESPEKKAVAQAVPDENDGQTEAVSMVNLEEGSSLSDDDPSYGSYDDGLLINAILKENPDDGLAASEDLVFGMRPADADRVCPNCGMPLVGKTNYCMGCGKNVDPLTGTGGPGVGNPFDGSYIKGMGYGGGNAYIAREEALKKRRKKKKKNILEENGLAGFLLKLFGSLAGFLIGFFVLRWYFAPKDVSETLYREIKVIKIADVRSIAAGTKTISQDLLADDVNDRRDKNKQDKRNDQGQSGHENTEQTTNNALQKQRNQNFYGTLLITARGDKVLELEEEEVWDVEGLDSNDVTYIINNLNYQFESLQNHIFIDFEIIWEDQLVTMRFAYHHLDLTENVKEMVSLGLISAEGLSGSPGKEYLSLPKALAMFDVEGWRTERPINMMTPSPGPDEAETEGTDQ